MLKPGESGYESRVALRAEYALKNKMNKMQRHRIWLNDLTKIFALLYACVAKYNMALAEDMREMCDMSKCTPDEGHCWIGSMDGAQAYTIVRNHLFADKAYDQATLGVQEKHHACHGEGSDGDSAEPEWFNCGDGDSLGQPEGHAAVIKVSADEEPVAPEQLYVEEPVAFAAAVATGGEPIKPVQHAVADALSAGGAKKPHRRGYAPPQTGVDALPTTRCEIGALLPAGRPPSSPAPVGRSRRSGRATSRRPTRSPPAQRSSSRTLTCAATARRSSSPTTSSRSPSPSPPPSRRAASRSIRSSTPPSRSRSGASTRRSTGSEAVPRRDTGGTTRRPRRARHPACCREGDTKSPLKDSL